MKDETELLDEMEDIPLSGRELHRLIDYLRQKGMEDAEILNLVQYVLGHDD